MDKESVLQELRAVIDTGQKLKVKAVRQSVYHWAVVHFGSWEDACCAVGVKPSERGRKKGTKYKQPEEFSLKQEDYELLKLANKRDPADTLAKPEDKLPQKCRKCIWRDALYCPFPYCFKEEK